MRFQYAIITAKNEVIAMADTESQAIAEGRSVGAKQVIIDRTIQPTRVANPPLGSRGPQVSWRGIGNLRVNHAKAMRMSIEDAHALLWPMFPILKSGQLIKAWKTPKGMVDNLLGQNYKTQKKVLDAEEKRQFRKLFKADGADVQGLTLLPATEWGRKMGRAGINTCVGASAECKNACLVFSGRNQADPYNTVIKAAKLTALLREPDAFGRILFEACRRYLEGKRTAFKRYIRLNVFSDIPWELVYPELFTIRGQFYDYTKVPSRRVPKNYDLTFSYSGRNFEDTMVALRRRQRVAVVFLTKSGQFPARLWGQRVVDGDRHDVRPVDPAPSVVGLKYKVPRGRDVDLKNNVFIVPVQEIEGQFIAAVVPRDQPGVLEHVADDRVPAGARIRLPVVTQRASNTRTPRRIKSRLMR